MSNIVSKEAGEENESFFQRFKGVFRKAVIVEQVVKDIKIRGEKKGLQNCKSCKNFNFYTFKRRVLESDGRKKIGRFETLDVRQLSQMTLDGAAKEKEQEYVFEDNLAVLEELEGKKNSA